MPHVSRWLPYMALLTLIGLSVGLLPAAPVLAAGRTQDQPVDDLATDFTTGIFQRTSLAPIGATSTNPNQGGVELSPVGYIKSWSPSLFSLPEAVTNHASVVLNGRIYIIGGSVATGNVAAPSANVWMATPGADGDLSAAWTAMDDLPPVETECQPIPRPGFESLPDRTNVAAVAVPSPSGGHIYVIGGALSSTFGDANSTSAVVIGTVNAATGAVTWNNGPCLMDADGFQKRLDSAAATTIEVAGETFIYVVGGIERRPPNGPIAAQANPLKTVYFAKVNSDGSLVKRDGSSGWNINPAGFNIPVSGGTCGGATTCGIWNASLVAHTEPTDSGTDYALFLIGGQKSNSPEDSAAVYRGVIQTNAATKGEVDWNASVGNSADPFSATLADAREGVRSVAYNGNILAIGGRNVGSADPNPSRDVLSNQVSPDLRLPLFDNSGSSSNFYKSTNTLIEGRYNHASVIAPVGTAKFVYVLGGQGNSGSSDSSGSTDIFYGQIGDTATEAGFATQGTFYSEPHNIEIFNAKVLSVSWNAKINRSAAPMDIMLEFRTTVDPNRAEASWTPWTEAIRDGAAPADPRTVNGANSSSLPDGLSALFFQYRVKMTTTPPSAGGSWETPSLLDVNIKVEVPGWPNLQVPSGSPILDQGVLRGISAQIANTNPKPAGDPLQPVYDDAPGEFYIGLYIYGPGETAPTDAPAFGTQPDAYSIMNKNMFPRIPSYEATFNARYWCEGSDNVCGKLNYDVTKLFPTAGTYKVFVRVDNLTIDPNDTSPDPKGIRSYGNVQEAVVAGQEGEADNTFSLEFTISQGCPNGCGLPVNIPGDTLNPNNPVIGDTTIPIIYMPLVFKP